MTPDRWHRLNELFHAALDQPRDAREEFLQHACGDDEDLRSEVSSLLACHDQATSFLEVPAAAVPHETDALVGQRLGQYAITRKIGQGGMGVVYQAEDTRLGRVVAVKALTPQFTRDERRRERLRREARAAAALSHPAIAMVYALEEFDDHLYIIGEYVPGETLRDELSRGPLSVPVLVDTAIDIARGLAAAHDQGIVHRDLKPENVIRSTDGAIKILDFGLARFQSGFHGSSSSAQLTELGTVMGTPAYMSPEQLRGWQVDGRSDVFSFGVMVYELAAGVHPFAGSDPASTIARLLEVDPPDVSTLNRFAPADLNRILVRCLQKDREQRYDTARELVGDLEALRRSALSSAHGGRSPSTPAEPGAPATQTPLWWWRFHQVSVALVEYLMLYPMWMVRGWIGTSAGAALFFCSVAAVVVGATLRLNLWFTSRFYPAELTAQRSKTGRWIRATEILFVICLLIAAGLVGVAHVGVAALLGAVAIWLLVSAVMIEPATTRAAFRRRGGRTPKRKPKRT